MPVTPIDASFIVAAMRIRPFVVGDTAEQKLAGSEKGHSD